MPNPLRRLSDRWRRERRTGLNHHIPMPDDLMAVADATRETAPCGCTPDSACLTHDGLYWMALERKEGLQ